MKKKKQKPLLTNINDNHIKLLELCMTNYTYEEIAEIMDYQKRTVTSWINDLFRYYKVTNRAALVVAALKNKLIKL